MRAGVRAAMALGDGPSPMEITRELPPADLRYSICTIVTDPPRYRRQVAQFAEYGFIGDDCEYLYVDNSETNRVEAYAAINQFLLASRGTFIILCHQDLVLLSDGRERLDTLLDELARSDPDWGLCGNAGAKSDGSLALSISDPNTPDTRLGGPFPSRVFGLDENFIVVRRDANIAASHDLAGFHLYGSDLCIVADMLGFHAYVIDFHLRHESGGHPDATFDEVRRATRAKWRRAFRPRWQHVTTLRPFLLTGSATQDVVLRAARQARLRLLSRN